MCDVPKIDLLHFTASAPSVFLGMAIPLRSGIDGTTIPEITEAKKMVINQLFFFSADTVRKRNTCRPLHLEHWLLPLQHKQGLICHTFLCPDLHTNNINKLNYCVLETLNSLKYKRRSCPVGTHPQPHQV